MRNKTLLLVFVVVLSTLVVGLAGCTSAAERENQLWADFGVWKSKQIAPLIGINAPDLTDDQPVNVGVASSGKTDKITIYRYPGNCNPGTGELGEEISQSLGSQVFPIDLKQGRWCISAQATRCYNTPANYRVLPGNNKDWCPPAPITQHADILVDTTDPVITRAKTISDEVENPDTFTVEGRAVDAVSGMSSVFVAGRKADVIRSDEHSLEFRVIIPYNELFNLNVAEVVAIDRAGRKARVPFDIPFPLTRWEKWVNGARRQIIADAKYQPAKSWFSGYGNHIEWRFYADGELVENLANPPDWLLTRLAPLWAPWVVGILLASSSLFLLFRKINRASSDMSIQIPTIQSHLAQIRELEAELHQTRTKLALLTRGLKWFATYDLEAARKVGYYLAEVFPNLDLSQLQQVEQEKIRQLHR